MALQLQTLLTKAILLPHPVDVDTPISLELSKDESISENNDNPFAPTTCISVPALHRATHINEQTPEQLGQAAITSDICEKSANPDYNLSVKFNYDCIQKLVNDLLLTQSTQCNILQHSAPASKAKKGSTSKVENEIFGTITLDWCNWLLSAIKNKASEKLLTTMTLPIVDVQNSALKKGEISVEIMMFTPNASSADDQAPDADPNSTAPWQKCDDFLELLPPKYSLLTIASSSISAIPTAWFSAMSDGNKQSIAISFEVLCSDEYSETVDIAIPLQRASEDGDQTDAAGQVLADKQWVFLVDEAGLKYLLQRVESKQAFEIQFQHIS
eukprot:CAMPEP_0197029818 /NCGR_PEP_ID=MMETSP1384-20130603/9185_1 /TAXON_ID=29189 /ORGANISM="Ammonia sp." /LENGTH=327 /DNA_ID=CAMNT_0042459055 /DNA_START=46 /DNA_END=1026 /DNA_ORIENTATION=+